MDEFADWVRDAFDLGEGPVTRGAGGRGADGEVWRLGVTGREFAVKRPFRALDLDRVRGEARLLDHLARRGVEVPTHVATPDGRLVVPVPDELGGGSARVSHWVDGVPVGDRTCELGGQLGTLLAQLHRAGPVVQEPPRSWYTAMLPPAEWAGLVERSVGRPWHDALAARWGDLAAYAQLVDRAGPGARPFIEGHCDLHPDNALVAPDGSLRALDWEDCGPLDPARELAKALVQWHVLVDDVDEDAVRQTLAAYRAAGGPGVPTGRADFAMVLCAESNFLAHQVRLALDDEAPPARREQAVGEISDSLGGYLPTMDALERVWALCAA